MDLADDLIAVSLELLTELGQTITYNRVTNSAYDTDTSGLPQSTASFTVHGLLEDLPDGGKSAGLTELAHKKITASGGDFSSPPDRNDTLDVVLTGKRYSVIDFEIVALADQAVLYVIYVRRG